MRASSSVGARTCPLCGQTLLVQSEEECEQHIAACAQFRAEYGPGAQRSGLVSGFDDAVSGAASSPDHPKPRAATVESLCEEVAAALVPLVPVALCGTTSDSTLEDAIRLIAFLAGSLLQSAADASRSEDFGLEEVLSVTLGPYVPHAGAEGVLSGLKASFEKLQAAATMSEVALVCEQLLVPSLRRRMEGYRFCEACGKSDSKLVTCSRCKVSRYCDQRCQRKAWPAHKLRCTAVQ
jgi:hypothetical protein